MTDPPIDRRERRFRIAAPVLFLALAAIAPASAATLPSGFGQSDVVAGRTNLNAPTAVAYAPDGRTFVTEKAGRVKVVNPGSTSATTLIDLSAKVNSFSDRGLLGLAVDKDFEANGFLYLLYVYELNPSNPDSSAPMVSRLTRITVRPNNTLVLPVGSSDPETVILGKHSASPCPVPDNTRDCITADFYWHTIGTVRSDPVDGTLWLGSGDSHAPAVDEHTWRTYDENSFAGKIIHIDRNGRGLPGHPFCPADSNLDHVCTKIYAKGFRNPFRFQLRPGKGPVVGDVGNSSWEEVDFVEPGRNYGWPCYEASRKRLTAEPQCAALFAKEGTTEAATAPDWEYAHNTDGASITLGPVYDGSTYPSHFRGDLFVGDYVQGWIKRLEISPDDDVTAVHDFATEWEGGVDLEMHPSGDLSYVDIGFGVDPPAPAVRRYTYTGSTNSPPDVVARAAPSAGPPPLAVQFTGSDTTDPDGDDLTFDWDFGDGSPHSDVPDPSHTYTTEGDHTALLTVTDSEGNSSVRSVPITVSENTAPSATIEAPADESLYRDGVVVNLRGSATDVEDGPLTGSSLRWRILLHHNTHIHELTELTGAQPSFTPLVDHDADSFYEIRLTATDSGGRSSSQTIEIRPETSELELASSPAGAPLGYGDEEEAAPFSREPAIGFQAPVTAPETFVRGGRTYRFEGWSDGGARAHSISVPPGSPQYTATYRAEGVDTLVLEPVADTHVDDLNPTTSYGAEPSFEVDAGPEQRQAFFKFDLDGVDGRQVVGARLALRQADGSVYGGDVRAVASNAWTEGVTWSTRPALGATLASFGPAVFGRAYEVDLGAGAVTGDGLLSLGMSTPHTNGSSWSSRESTRPPRLIVEVEKYACANGVDDDGDGNADLADLGCLFAADDDENQAPVAAAGATPSTGDVPLQVAFNAVGSVDPEGDELSYEWDFDDGSAASTMAAASNLYTRQGTYTATLTVTDEHGESDTATVEVDVTEPVEAVAGASPTSGTAPLTVQFTGSDSVDPEGGELDFDWDFGDGSAGSSVADPSHVYMTAGTYMATLTVSAGGGREASASVEVRVAAPACADGEDDDGDGKVDFPADLGCMSATDDDENTAPVAAAGATPVSGEVPLSVAFSAAGSVDPERDSLGYEWDFGDGSEGAATAAADHLYTTPETYTATLTVTDEHAESDTATVEVEVTEPVEAVAGATPTSGMAPLTVQFTGSDSVDPEGGELDFDWDFGDGSAGSSVADPSHVYTAPGTYTATLTVSAGGGREDSASVEVVVKEPPVEETGGTGGTGGTGSSTSQGGTASSTSQGGGQATSTTLLPPAFSGVRIQRRSVTLRRSAAWMRLACSPTAVGTCTGALALVIRVPTAATRGSAPGRGARASAGARRSGASARKTVRLGTVRFSIASGQTERVRVKLSRRGRRLLEAHRRLETTAQVTAHDGLMRKRVTKSSLVLKLKRSGSGRARSGAYSAGSRRVSRAHP